MVSNWKFSGPMRNRAIYEKLRNLKVGEELTISYSEWRTMTSPVIALRAARYSHQFKVHRLADRGGWVVVRLRDAPAAELEKHHGRSSYGPMATRRVYERVRSMKVGEELTLSANDWRSATSPMHAIGRSERYRDNFKVRELEGGGGWVISRVK